MSTWSLENTLFLKVLNTIFTTFLKKEAGKGHKVLAAAAWEGVCILWSFLLDMVRLDLHFKKISVYGTEKVWRGEKDCGMMS